MLRALTPYLHRHLVLYPLLLLSTCQAACACASRGATTRADGRGDVNKSVGKRRNGRGHLGNRRGDIIVAACMRVASSEATREGDLALG